LNKNNKEYKMERRNFFKLGAGLLAAAAAPSMVTAANYRETNPKAWTIMNDMKAKEPTMTGIEAAMKDIFGTSKASESKVTLKAPAIAENGAVIPISMKTKLDGITKMAILQNANPEATVAVFDVNEKTIPDFSVRIKMQKTGDVVAVAQTKDGKLHMAKALVKVTIGGCGG
jgi:sulfur-oxidizing protein SoxY